MAIYKAVFLKFSGATDLPLNFVGTADPFPKTISFIFTEHNGLIKIQNHTNINIKHGKKIRADAINSASYEVFKNIRRELRYGRQQEVVNFLT
jgi:hypothetical protein